MELTIENSWWNEGGLWEDHDLIKAKNSALHYRPAVFSTEELRPQNVFTLRGPRRSGKTVTLKLLVADLIEKQGEDPHAIVWTSLDAIRTLSQMEEHLFRILRNHGRKQDPKYLFVDEVTSVIGWQRVVKSFVDKGLLSKTCTILTGSSSFDLKKGSERMAGRKGTSEKSDRVLLPMSYEDFLEQVPAKLGASVSAYLKVGGFPFRVNEYISGPTKFDPLKNLSPFDDTYFYEFNRRRLDRNIALEILSRLSEVKNQAISYESFGKPLSIAKETLKKYLNALGDAFLLATIYAFDTARNRVAIKKDKKFVWVDPALSFLAPGLQQGEQTDEATRAEWAVGIELLRRHEIRMWEGLSAPRNLFTWKSSSGKEVDYLIVDKSKKTTVPIEVKYQNSISDWDFQVIERAFHQGVLVTKDFGKKRKESIALPLDGFLRDSSTPITR